MIKAIVFDFDGTVIDTETAWYTACREAYEHHGVELTLEQYAQCIGTSHHVFNPYEYLMTELGMQIDKEQFRLSIHRRHTQLMEEERVRPGVLELLQEAREAGLGIGLASSSSSSWIDKHLELLGIRAYFDCVRTSDHVEKVKPDPALYVQTLECLGVKPEEAIAIEDSPNGAKAAIAAGMYCVIVPNEVTKGLAFGKGHYRLDALNELTLEQLLASPGGPSGSIG